MSIIQFQLYYSVCGAFGWCVFGGCLLHWTLDFIFFFFRCHSYMTLSFWCHWKSEIQLLYIFTLKNSSLINHRIIELPGLEGPINTAHFQPCAIVSAATPKLSCPGPHPIWPSVPPGMGWTKHKQYWKTIIMLLMSFFYFLVLFFHSKNITEVSGYILFCVQTSLRMKFCFPSSPPPAGYSMFVKFHPFSMPPYNFPNEVLLFSQFIKLIV